MTPDESKKIQNDIEAVIKITVNHKIDLLHQKLDEYIKGDMEWKKEAQPIIDLGTDMRGFSRGLVYILGSFASAIAIIGGGYELIKSVLKK